MCPYAIPSTSGKIHCTLAQFAVDPKDYPCFTNYEKCPIYQAEAEGDCSTCPLRDVCGR